MCFSSNLLKYLKIIIFLWSIFLFSCEKTSDEIVITTNLKLTDIRKVISEDLIASAESEEKFAIPRKLFKNSPLPVIWPYNDIDITSPYGFRLHPVLHTIKYHRGLDFGRSLGTDVYSVAKGVVITTKYHSLFGNLVEIDHGHGLISQYAHLSEIIVHPGDSVDAGAIVGYTGSTGRSTGAHLHLGIIAGGHSIDPFYFLGRTWIKEELKKSNLPWVYGWKN